MTRHKQIATLYLYVVHMFAWEERGARETLIFYDRLTEAKYSRYFHFVFLSCPNYFKWHFFSFLPSSVISFLELNYANEVWTSLV